jgi:D-alanine-D-alanine ligase
MAKQYPKGIGAAGAKVAVLMGGVSRERAISLQSGRCVEQALKQAGVNVVAADIAPNKLDILDDKSIDVFFIALHGTFGEDGELQTILEKKRLVYTGSGPAAGRLAFDKWASKKAFAKAGVMTPAAIMYAPGEDEKELEKQVEQLGEKYVVKPLREGSTIGVLIVGDARSAVDAAKKCSQDFGDCMIEQHIAGREITVGILGRKALPIIEIRTQTGFYDYQAKYLDDRTQYLFDTLEPATEKRIQQSAMACFDALGCRHLARVDFMISEDGNAYVLEANTIPGMTTHSLLPKAAAKAGLSMSDLCVAIVNAAVADKPKKSAPIRRTRG